MNAACIIFRRNRNINGKMLIHTGTEHGSTGEQNANLHMNRIQLYEEQNAILDRNRARIDMGTE